MLEEGCLDVSAGAARKRGCLWEVVLDCTFSERGLEFCKILPLKLVS